VNTDRDGTVQGGQGRSGQEVVNSGIGIAICFAVFMGLIVFGLLKHLFP
jgi:hypothetical protein